MVRTAPEDDADSLVMAAVAWAVFVARRTFPGTRIEQERDELIGQPYGFSGLKGRS